jgi:type II secretory pathway component GspD/PulD (secretin)
MVFLRPLVIRDSTAAARVTGERYDYIRDVQIGQRLPPSPLLPELPTPQLPPFTGDPAAPGQAVPPLLDLRQRPPAEANAN